MQIAQTQFLNQINQTKTLMNMSSKNSVLEVIEINPFDAYPEPLLQFAYACCIIFMLLGIPGNLITIAALVSCKKYRNATAIFIISLHISNLIFCCLVLPLTAVNYAKKCWTFGQTMCQIYGIMKFGLIANTHLTVVAITINRYIMVCYPLIYPRFYKKRNIVIFLISIWVSGFALFLPSFLEIWGRFDMHPKDGICTMVRDRNNRSPKTLLVSLAFVGTYLTIILCYGRIWWTRRAIIQNCSKHKSPDTQRPMITSLSDSSVVCQSPSASGSPTDNRISKFNYSVILTRKISKISFYAKRKKGPPLPTRKDKKLGTMILALLISFAICHLPLMLTRLSTHSDILHSRNPYASTFGNLLEYSSVFLSPIVYVIISNEYRRAYKIFFDKIKTNVMRCFR